MVRILNGKFFRSQSLNTKSAAISRFNVDLLYQVNHLFNHFFLRTLLGKTPKGNVSTFFFSNTNLRLPSPPRFLPVLPALGMQYNHIYIYVHIFIECTASQYLDLSHSGLLSYHTKITQIRILPLHWLVLTIHQYGRNSWYCARQTSP